MALTDTTAIAVLLPEVETALSALAGKIEASLATADLSGTKMLLDALVAELASLAHPDPTVAAKLKADVHAGVHKLGHLFGSVVRDVADAVDPTVTVTPAATATAVATPSAVAAPVVVPITK